MKIGDIVIYKLLRKQVELSIYVREDVQYEILDVSRDKILIYLFRGYSTWMDVEDFITIEQQRVNTINEILNEG